MTEPHFATDATASHPERRSPPALPWRATAVPVDVPPFAAAAGALVTLVGALVLVGWAADVAALKAIVPGTIVMIPNTAVCFMLAGVSLWLQRDERAAASPGARRATRVAAALVLVLGVLFSLERLFGWRFGIDTLLFPEAVSRYPYRPVGVPAVNSAVCFALAGGALLLLDSETRRGTRPAQYVAALGLAVAVLAVIGHLFGARPLYAFDQAAGMALLTALTFTALDFGIFLSRPTRGAASLLTSGDAGGVLARRLLPAVFVVPLGLGWLWLHIRERELASREGAVALFVVATMGVLVAVVLRTARALGATDRERAHVLERESLARAEAERLADLLHSQTVELERQTEEARAAADEAEVASRRARDAAAAAERARRDAEESERRFRHTADSAPMLMWSAGPDGGCDWFNEPWLRFTGRPMAQELGDGWTDGVHPEDLRHCLDVFRGAIAARRPFELECRLRRHDGEYRWVLDHGVPRFDEDGAFVGFIGSCVDVTERKAAAARAARLQAATEAFSAALSPDEVVERIAREGAEATGATWGAVALVEEDGKTLRLTGARDVPPAFAASGGRLALDRRLPATDAVRDERPIIVESPREVAARYPEVAHVLAAEGARAVAAVPLTTQDRTIGAILLRYDHPREFPQPDVDFLRALARIAAESVDRARLYDAERRARGVAEEASRVKSDFLAVMSHELRTPLNAIIGYNSLLMSGIPEPATDAQRRQLGRIAASAQHLLALIDEVLTLSRLEAGKERVSAMPVRVDEALEEVASVIEPMAAAKGLALEVHAPPAPLVVETDPGKLRQSLINLLSNAVKFTERGRVTLRASDDGEAVCFEVRDTGIGIAPEHQERIFEPFWQVRQSTTRVVGGTGLGLNVTRRLARMMGGDVTLASRAGEGSTFTLRLPKVWREESGDA